MSSIEETVIVKVSWVGMVGEGIGTATVVGDDYEGDPERISEALYRAINQAAKNAVLESKPLFNDYMREKYQNES